MVFDWQEGQLVTTEELHVDGIYIYIIIYQLRLDSSVKMARELQPGISRFWSRRHTDIKKAFLCVYQVPAENGETSYPAEGSRRPAVSGELRGKIIKQNCV